MISKPFNQAYTESQTRASAQQESRRLKTLAPKCLSELAPSWIGSFACEVLSDYPRTITDDRLSC